MTYAVYGTGGFAREVAPLITRSGGERPDLVFVDDNEQAPSVVNGYNVINFDLLCSDAHRARIVVVAVGDGGVRRRIEARILEEGLAVSTLFASTAIVQEHVDIGRGSILSDYVVITSNIKIGRSFHANIYSYVGHDCIIGDYVTFAPRVNCNGNVHIGDDVYVGTNASIIQGSRDEPMTIGAGSVIAMGAVVTKPVPPNSLMAGNPARLVRMLK
jgi:sugar O-acyltransferase (sialic acid O-acetyltransferase NeuD family)